MARKIVVFALVCFVLVGLAFVDATPEKSGAATGNADAGSGAPASDDDIGNDSEAPAAAGDASGMAVAGPVGGPVPDGAFDESGSGTAGSASTPSGAAALELSAVVGLATVSGFVLF